MGSAAVNSFVFDIVVTIDSRTISIVETTGLKSGPPISVEHDWNCAKKQTLRPSCSGGWQSYCNKSVNLEAPWTSPSGIYFLSDAATYYIDFAYHIHSSEWGYDFDAPQRTTNFIQCPGSGACSFQ